MADGKDLIRSGEESRARIMRDTRPLGDCPGELGKIVCTFKDAAGERQSKLQIENKLTGMVQARMISPDVAQAIMDGFSEYPKTITMEMLERAWLCKAGKRLAYFKAKARREAAEEELRHSRTEEDRAKELAPDDEDGVYTV